MSLVLYSKVQLYCSDVSEMYLFTEMCLSTSSMQLLKYKM